MQSLDTIGFYTLSDRRARNASATSPLMRCELVLTPRCNFACPYCRGVGCETTLAQASATLALWLKDGLRNVRFSGGEPTLYDGLADLVTTARRGGVEHIALSTNGSAGMERYRALLKVGVNDVSVSLDACCAADGDKLAGARRGSWQRVVANIRALAKLTYVTVGVVLTDDNAGKVEDIIGFAHDLGVADIRVIPAAQKGEKLDMEFVSPEVIAAHPILAYRVTNAWNGVPVRGLGTGDANRCRLVLDDMAVTGDAHYPCIIYMREGGAALGRVGETMRQERAAWARSHDTHADPICSRNCLDVCRDYNNVAERTRRSAGTVISRRPAALRCD
jgi:molybdenum cofactor biosynthesis enzyme MoaA